MLLDQTVANYMGHSSPAGDIGIEIETEFKGPLPPSTKTKFWKTEADGSLRNGLEYTSVGAIPFEKLEDALIDFEAMTKGYNFRESVRTSVHLHVNSCKLTMKEVLQVVTAYWLFENVLVEPHGSLRRGNLFCLRAKDAEDIVSEVVHLVRALHYNTKKFSSSLWGDSYRYAALNLASLAKYGSMEFRFLSGTTDTKEIYFWVDLLYHFWKNASSMDIKDMVELAGAGQPQKENLLTLLVGEQRKKELLSMVDDNWPTLVEENVPYAMRILAAFGRSETKEEFKKPYIISTMYDDLETDEFVHQGNLTFPPKPKKRTLKKSKFIYHPFENVPQKKQNIRFHPAVSTPMRKILRAAEIVEGGAYYIIEWQGVMYELTRSQYRELCAGLTIHVGGVNIGWAVLNPPPTPSQEVEVPQEPDPTWLNVSDEIVDEIVSLSNHPFLNTWGTPASNG
jgi:hypothetical protein